MVLCTVVLCGISGWALQKVVDQYVWLAAVFAIFLLHSITGLLTFVGLISVRIYVHTAFIAEVIHLPFLNAEIYRKMGMENVSLGHAGSCIVPLVSLYVLGDRSPGLTDIFDFLNLVSLIYLALKLNNKWCGYIGLNHVAFRMYGYYNAFKLSLLTLGLNIFSILAVNCMLDELHQEQQTEEN